MGEEKKDSELPSWEKKIKSRLTKYEWKELKEKIKMEEEIASFRREFRKYMSDFIAGAFAFVAALMWRDAIKSILDRIIMVVYIPVHQEWILNLVTALFISIIAVFAIIMTSRILKPNEDVKINNG